MVDFRGTDENHNGQLDDVEPLYPSGPFVSVDPGVHETPDNPFITEPAPGEPGWGRVDSDNDGAPDYAAY